MSLKYAENPPKAYEDVLVDLETLDVSGPLKVRAARWCCSGSSTGAFSGVDNPHTKPFWLWEWLIGEVQRARPDVLFLAEAFYLPWW